MKHLAYFIFAIMTVLTLQSCHDTPEYKDSLYGNFDALTDIVATKYCFLREKDIDWQETSARYRDIIKPDMTLLDEFNILAALLDNLKDGHVNLVSRFNTSYYRKWWTDYPQDFNLRTLQEYYLEFDYMQTSGISYKMLPDSVGYMYYPSFSTTVGETSLDYILAILHKSKGLIIDIRNNGGGLLTNINTLVGRFIDKKITGGYIRHKTGPGAGDFSEPYPIEFEPAETGRITYSGPVMVLTNRSCYSAANNFVAVMKQLPQVRIVGARTGGGGGLPFTAELPNGWSVRFSASPITDALDQPTEFGIDPTPGYEVHGTPEDFAAGCDPILDFAIARMLADQADSKIK